MVSIINKITVESKKEHFSTIVFLHGLGQYSWFFSILFNYFFTREKFPHTKFIFPLASLKLVEIDGPGTASLINAWYSINGDLSKIQREIPLEEVDKQIKIDKNELLKSSIEIDGLIQQEINFGILPQNIITIGHSQGGSMALTVGLISKHSLGGIICISGFLPCRKEVLELARNKDKKIPILICHGKQDAVVPYWLAEKSAEILKVEPRGYPNIGHLLISNEVLNDAVSFCENVFYKKK